MPNYRYLSIPKQKINFVAEFYALLIYNFKFSVPAQIEI